MLKYLVLVFVLAAWFMAQPLGAGIYKYVDENGVTCFTDDLTLVPETQRSEEASIKAYRAPARSEDDKKTISEKERRRREREKEGMKLDNSALELTRIKEALDEELQTLKKRREVLVDASKKEMSAQEQVEFNRLAKELNDDTLRYKEKRAKFQEQVEAHNQKVESL